MNILEELKKNSLIFSFGVQCKIVWYDYIIDTLELVKIFLRKKGLIHKNKFQTLRNLKGKYRGKRCFIIATGPSLTLADLNSLKGEYTIAVNAIVKLLDKMDYIPTFLGIQDQLVYEKIGHLIENSSLEKIFVSESLYDNKVRNKNDNRFIQFPLYSCRHAVHGDKQPLSTGFSEDASNVVYSGYSITYSLLQIAVYMGFSEIYLLGCDCSYDTSGGKQYFVESGHFDKYAGSAGERMIYAFSVAQKIIEKEYPHVKVYNATRGGMLEVFPRRTIDEITF